MLRNYLTDVVKFSKVHQCENDIASKRHDIEILLHSCRKISKLYKFSKVKH